MKNLSICLPLYACALTLAFGTICTQLIAQQPAPASVAKPAAPVVAEAHGSRAASVLVGLSDDLQTLSHAVEPAVVKIYATGLAPISDESGKTSFLAQQRMLGAGAIMDSNGYILTNAHVVQHARSLSVLVPDLSNGLEGSDNSRSEPPVTALPQPKGLAFCGIRESRPRRDCYEILEVS